MLQLGLLNETRRLGTGQRLAWVGRIVVAKAFAERRGALIKFSADTDLRGGDGVYICFDNSLFLNPNHQHANGSLYPEQRME